MAVDLTPDAYWSRATTGLTLPVSFCGWVRFDTTPAVYRVALYHGTGSYTNCLAWVRLANGTLRAEHAGYTGPATAVLSNSTWYFFASTINTGTNNFRVYWRAEGQTSLLSAQGTWSGTFAQDTLRWGIAPGTGSGNGHDGQLAYCRAFTGVLAEADLLAESASPTAIATEWADWPFADAATSTTDASGNSRTLTFTAASGSQADATGPNISLGASIGALAETDALAPVARTTARTVGALTEADSPTAPSRAVSVTVGALPETDALAPAARSTTVQVQPLTETDALAGVAASRSLLVGVLTETDTLSPPLRSVSKLVGTWLEADVLHALDVIAAAVDINVVLGSPRLRNTVSFGAPRSGTTTGETRGRWRIGDTRTAVTAGAPRTDRSN